MARSLRWGLRGAMGLAGAALLGGAFTAAASADDSLVGDLLGGAEDVLEETTAVVESVAGADADEAAPSTVQVEQSSEQPDSVVTEVVDSVVETTEVVAEVADPVEETTEAVTEVADPVEETTEAVTEV
ncbi:MAG TPA: hypothetical protein H9815_13745, partial [Candidatus Ruania gallistercoris]|nr:hypothetical protein [Candidatus Ruania gallistercoris]